jgi:hypothetical protein
MALSLNALVTEVNSIIHRTDMTGEIQTGLLQQITWLETLDYWPWRMTRNQAGLVLASATWSYSLPTDFGEDLAINIVETDKRDSLDRLAYEDFIRKYPDPGQDSGGQPTAYSIGYALGTASAGSKAIFFPHPADATYTCEMIYYNRRADSTGTDFPNAFTDLEKWVLVYLCAAYIEGTKLKIDTCRKKYPGDLCGCTRCERDRWMQALQARYTRERTRETPKWKHPKKSGAGIYDVRGGQKTYNV